MMWTCCCCCCCCVTIVSPQLARQDYDFFPMNRALSLTNTSKDSTESKLDDLLAAVQKLVDKQKQEVGQQYESHVHLDLILFAHDLICTRSIYYILFAHYFICTRSIYLLHIICTWFDLYKIYSLGYILFAHDLICKGSMYYIIFSHDFICMRSINLLYLIWTWFNLYNIYLFYHKCTWFDLFEIYLYIYYLHLVWIKRRSF